MTMCNVPALLDAAMAGVCLAATQSGGHNRYRVSILAYGQTGSGKTFTMCGPEESIESDTFGTNTSDGVIARSCQYLLNAAEQQLESTEAKSYGKRCGLMAPPGLD
eukprot:scaffold139494_cov34-Prasinocladus_malaysianus.AAC.1